MTGSFVFGNYNSASAGIYVIDGDIDNAPTEVYKRITVPGRNGVLLISQGYRENVRHLYRCIIPSDDAAYISFRNAMLSQSGYKRLSDSFHPTEFYSAYVVSISAPIKTKDRDMWKCLVEFSRKPQRFMLSGETELNVLSSGAVVRNSSYMPSKPLIRIYGTGKIRVADSEGNESLVNVLSNSDFIDLDCETMEAYTGDTNQNENVQVENYVFPYLGKGDTTFYIANTITKLVITPRWWRL